MRSRREVDNLWTIAKDGGVEWAFLRNWTMRGEYLHYSFENVTTISSNSANPQLISHSHRGLDVDIIRAAINYKF